MDEFGTPEFELPREGGAAFTLALLIDVVEVLDRHGYPAPTGFALVELCQGMYWSCHSPGRWSLG